MADLGTLRPGAANTTGLPTTGSLIAAPGGATALSDDSDATRDTQDANASGVYQYGRELANTPANFVSMDTLLVQCRTAWSATPSNSTWGDVAARVVGADGSTILAAATAGGAFQSMGDPPETTAFGLRPASPQAFAFVNTTADKAAWDGAIVQFQWTRTRSKGGDASNMLISELYITGTYTSGPVTETGSFTAAAVLRATRSGAITADAKIGGDAAVAFDSFAEAADTRFTDHTADRGGQWEGTQEDGGVLASEDVLATRVFLDGSGGFDNFTLPAVPITDFELAFETWFSSDATSDDWIAFGRNKNDSPPLSTDRCYGVRRVATGAGTGSLQIVRVDQAGTPTVLASVADNVDNTTHRSIRLRVTGSSPTQLQARVWTTGGAEPGTWALDTTDSSAEYQGAGYVSAMTHYEVVPANIAKADDLAVFEVAAQPGGSLTADAVLRRTWAGAIVADAIVHRTQAGSLVADAIVRRSRLASLTADAVVRATISGGLALDAVLRRERSAAVTFDAWIAVSTGGSLTVDAVVRRTQVVQVSADAVIRAVQTDQIAVEAIVNRTASATFTADAVLRALSTGSVTADAVVRKIVSAALTADAVILRPRTGGFSADAVLRSPRASFVTADAIIRTTNTGVLTASATVQRTQPATYTADAILRSVRSASIAADAIIRRAQAGSFTVDAWVASAGVGTGAFTADAVIRRVQSASLTADAVVRITRSGAIVADALLRRISVGSFGADAIVRREQTGAVTAQAVIRRERAATIVTDAVLRRTQAGSVSFDAVIASGFASITVDAIIRRIQTGSFTLDAIIDDGAALVVVSATIEADVWGSTMELEVAQEAIAAAIEVDLLSGEGELGGEPMSDIELVEGDSAPPLIGTIRDSAGDAVSLSGVTSVKLQMRRVGDRRYTVDAAAEITDSANGKVRYVWAANDLDRAGVYEVQWELTYATGKIQTTQPPDTLTVREQ